MLEAAAGIAAHLRRTLAVLPPAARYYVAFSGGLDSQVLLHALAQLRDELAAPVAAIHIHHGLSPNADRWAAQCRAACAALGVPLEVREVQARPVDGEGREAAARAARYAAFADILEADDVLLTAHHQDDQAETLLLMLLRGAGVAGLAGMPACRGLGRGRLARPLLPLSRQALRDYAVHHGLTWVEDESNFDTSLQRNFLRHEVLPRLRDGWPAADRALARSAAHLGEAAELLAELAAGDVAALAGAGTDTLSVAGLLTLSPARRRNALRYWIVQCGLPLPSTVQLQRIEREALAARADAEPQVAWPGAEVRRYRDRLYALAPLAPPPEQTLSWDLQRPLSLPAGLGTLLAEPGRGAGLARVRCAGARITVGFRRGGERCAPAGRGEHHALKKLLQEAGVPPWQRARIPLLFVDDQLAQVVGHWACRPFAAAEHEEAIFIRWLPPAEIASGGENNDN